ncbi:cytochrome P450 [Russula compacta]|nr:cytochrome P450 [Russula compacta]
MDSLAIVLSALLAWPAILVFLYLRSRDASLKHLRGPEPSTFWLGAEADLTYQNEVGDCEFKWMRKYGTAWRRTGCIGRDHLMLADPKAIQHVLHKPGYHYDKAVDRAHFNELVVGKGLASPLINVTVWFSRATLDVIGEAAFDYQFGSLDDVKTPLAKQYDNLFIDSTLYPSGYALVFRESWNFIPELLLKYARYVPAREYRRFRSFLDYIRNFARGLIEESKAKGDGKDIMSLLLRANESSDPKSRLTDREAIDQISTFLLAGHDTTSASMVWFFFEVAKHPAAQERIRKEIAAGGARSEGYTAADLDSMVYTQAALKESLRLHPIFWTLERVANEDDVIPLAFPITTKSGEQITSIPIKKGTPIDISTPAYNRLPEIWGDDADEWNPQRLPGAKHVAGVQRRRLHDVPQVELLEVAAAYASAGDSREFYSSDQARSSVLEMQTMIITLLDNFEFSLPPQNEETKIRRRPTHLMVPMVDGRKGAWMGLLVKRVN